MATSQENEDLEFICPMESELCEGFSRSVSVSEESNSESASMPNISSVIAPSAPPEYKRMDILSERVSRALTERGYVTVDNFLGLAFGGLVLREVRQAHKQGFFEKGKIVAESQKLFSSSKHVRGDEVIFVDGKEDWTRIIKRQMDTVDVLMAHTFKCLDLLHGTKLSRTNAMLACYPAGGTSYKRHIDNPSKDGRLLTSIYYLNYGWTEADGGVLRLYPTVLNHEQVIIEPVFDRLILFWSDQRTPHEVLPSNNCRYAITLWYHDVKEKQEHDRLRAEKENQLQMRPKLQTKRRQSKTMDSSPANKENNELT